MSNNKNDDDDDDEEEHFVRIIRAMMMMKVKDTATIKPSRRYRPTRRTRGR